MGVQAKNGLPLFIRRVDYFATLVYLYYLYFRDGFLGVAEHFVLAVWKTFRNAWNMIIQGYQKVSVKLMITVQKTRKNILNSFNHLP
jgi:hypothetical protein